MKLCNLNFLLLLVPSIHIITDTTESSASNRKNKQKVKDIICLIKGGDLDETDLCGIASALGESLKAEVYKDSLNIQKNVKEIDTLSLLNVKDFVSERPCVLTEFLKGITGVNVFDDKVLLKKAVSMCVLYEQLYYVRNGRFVGPFTFSHTLVKWAIAGSKTIASLDAAA